LRFWADACLTPRLEDVAHARGYEATSNRTRGMLTASDPELYPVVTAEEWVFITNNERDFLRLADAAELHPGLVVLPQGTVAQQAQWFGEVIDYIEHRATEDREPPADWMVCRIVSYDAADGSIRHGWLPESP
jgi:predicted nuclease of predicted toxin-antitoxin system